MMRRFCTIALIVACGAIASANPNLVQNGSFEDNNVAQSGYSSYGSYFLYHPTAPSWYFTGNAGISEAYSGWEWQSAQEGNDFAFLQSHYNEGTPGAVSQTLTGLTAGATYRVTFYADERDEFWNTSNDNSPDTLDVTVGSDQVFSKVIDNLALDSGTPPFWTASNGPGWEEFEATFVASSSSEVLEFAVANSDTTVDSSVFLDNVAVTYAPKPVPEPFTMTLGMGGLAIAMRRRKRKTSLERVR